MDTLKRWIPTLLSKKLGAFVLAFIAEVQSKPHQTARQIAIAVVTSAYVLAQAYLDSKKPV
jgi:hypothetical protein